MAGANDGGRLGGARADFVASLGRKVHEAREVLAALEDDPSAKPEREELRRRMHALGAASRLLRFDAMASALADALGVLDASATIGSLGDDDLAFLARVLDDLPALAWNEATPRETAPPAASPPEEAESTGGQAPTSLLVVGGGYLADALMDENAVRARVFECERTERPQTALQLARALAPDVMIVDVDASDAAGLVESLLDDPLTEPVPIVVVGSFHPGDDSRFVALGVAKALSKPVPPETLRRAVDEILDTREGRTMRLTLGEPTLEQLADKLAEELRRGLVESVDRAGRSCRVPLGEGTEVLGALWGAIARVQEIVAHKTGGAVRFGGDAPEGAIALAPWMHHDAAQGDRAMSRVRGGAGDVRLQGRRVVVADDDPGVTWFISDLLRTAGCEVHEALDGATALERAFQVQPELVVSDVLMPGMDGFALCRALRRDVALRDTPVILLSWKEDLLQRVRELGASAAAYMRKESDTRAILARVREVLRPRARIEARLRGDGEVRGRLDGITPRLLLELVGVVRHDARVVVRDASYLYEIEIRDGAPRSATRTSTDGRFLRGERALASLLGVGAGRFVVAPSVAPVHGELSGTLFDLLARPIASARGAISACTGARTMDVERILIDEAALDEYLQATPEPTRGTVKRLARGASPRQMLVAGEVSPSLLEDVLSDLARRGAICGVEGAGGADFLRPAIESALAVLRSAGKPRRTLPPNARPSAPPEPIVMHTRTPADVFAAELRSPPPAAPSETRRSARDDSEAPASLEDAVMREISEAPAAAAPEPSPPPMSSSLPSQDALPPPPPPRARSRWGIAVAVAAVAGVAGTGVYVASAPPEPAALAPAPSATATAFVAASASATSASAAPSTSASALALASASETPADLPAGAEVPEGFGMIEVSAPAGARVLIDGAQAGAGPAVQSVVAPGSHDVRVWRSGIESRYAIEVTAGKSTRVRSASAP